MAEQKREYDIYMSSRRTIMSGEVVTFATGFIKNNDRVFLAHDATGPFEVSASRDAVMVHKAECHSLESVQALVKAIQAAGAAMVALKPTWSGGHDSKFPEEPTRVDMPCLQLQIHHSRGLCSGSRGEP